MTAPSQVLGQALIQAVQQADFAATADNLQGRQPLVLMPAVDLAVVAFSARKQARWANVLFSREHPQGVLGDVDDRAGPVRNVRFDADLQDSNGDSVAWLPGANWSQLPFKPLHGHGPHRFVAPYPASLLKLMVAVGVCKAMDEGRCSEPEALAPMITVSDNDATDACVALLHRVGLLPERLNALLAQYGLNTLQVRNTTARGGWRNGDGAGVGQIHMTAWDTVRLLWLIDPDAPPAPWLAGGPPSPLQPKLQPPLQPLLQPASNQRLLQLLAAQQLDEVLSSSSLVGLPGWVQGLPGAPQFAHKTGTTENYASDAGLVKSGGTHYLVAVLTSLGTRYAPHERCATTWRLPALGAAVHKLVQGQVWSGP
jgi:Beta-lactamase enzyme family